MAWERWPVLTARRAAPRARARAYEMSPAAASTADERYPCSTAYMALGASALGMSDRPVSARV